MKLSFVLALIFCVVLVSAGSRNHRKNGPKRIHYEDNKKTNVHQSSQTIKNIGSTHKSGGLLSDLVNVNVLNKNKQTYNINQS
ncbi:hypothetical protein EDC96DRAFT_532698 [Choanephora cucurbitarum]|nr:hypothetical protein EDC96DRAFT_532698 [Choanephora cucurbitarum]